jgi:hypothetical protein
MMVYRHRNIIERDWQIFSGQNIHFQLLVGQKIYFMHSTGYIFIFYYNSVDYQVRPEYLFFYFLESRDQNFYFSIFGGQNTYLEKLPAPTPLRIIWPSPYQMIYVT